MRLRKPVLLSSLAVLAVLVIIVSRPAYLLLTAWLQDDPAVADLPAGYVDDASRMNAAHVAEVWAIPEDAATAESELRTLLQRASGQGLRVAISGARHSMGGHTIYPDGIVLNMLPFRSMELDADTRTLNVGSGARWSEVIAYLDPRGYSVSIMQSNDDFSIGGSVSVNCHGWQHGKPPIASTVRSLRLMQANGTIVRCDRSENQELFSSVLGGYGLFGVILDLEIDVVPNECYRREFELLDSVEYVSRFADLSRELDVGMSYGRLCVVPGETTFLREAILTTFRRVELEETPRLKDPRPDTLRREVFRAQIGSDAGKRLRWKAEKVLGGQLPTKHYSRNQLLRGGVKTFQEQNEERTDILHEYFIPPQQFMKFLEHVRAIVPRHRGDLLNVTVRDVREDKDTFLRYADRDLFAFVMLFSQPRTADGDARMEAMTQELIGAALQCNGRYYLPYRLHATRDQFAQAYPQASAFFERKRRYDPAGIFQNQFSLKYGPRSSQ